MNRKGLFVLIQFKWGGVGEACGYEQVINQRSSGTYKCFGASQIEGNVANRQSAANSCNRATPAVACPLPGNVGKINKAVVIGVKQP